MNEVALFTDVSLDPVRKHGIGGYFSVPASFLAASPQDMKRSDVSERLMLRRFENTSSTKLEVRTVLWALEEYRKEREAAVPEKIRIYTDSQCVAGLLKRRPGLEAKGFLSGRTNTLLKHASLYRRFYELFDELGFEVIKVAGHTRSSCQDTVHRMFSFLDKEVRKALGIWTEEP